MWKEWRESCSSRWQVLALTVAAAALLFTPVLEPDELSAEGRTIHGVTAGLVFLLATTLTAEAFAGERERRTIESLLTTPLTLEEVFAGKVLASFLPTVLAGPGVLVAHVPLLAMTGPEVLDAPGFLSSHLAFAGLTLAIGLVATITAAWAATVCATVRGATNLHSGLFLLVPTLIILSLSRVPGIGPRMVGLGEVRWITIGSVVLAGIAAVILPTVFRRFRDVVRRRS